MSTHTVTRRRFLWEVGGAAGILAAPRLAGAAITPYKLEVNKIDVYGTRDPQLMAMPSLAEFSGYFKDEGLTVERHFVASAGDGCSTVMSAPPEAAGRWPGRAGPPGS